MDDSVEKELCFLLMKNQVNYFDSDQGREATLDWI